LYYNLIGSMKRRLVLELKDSFSEHPIYSKIVPWIQDRYAFDERPQMGIVVKGASANKVQLSADNFLGSVDSHVMLAYLGAPVYPLEWVREDLACIRANGDQMPTPPGIYYIEILESPVDAQSLGKYIIDPLLTVNDEPVLRFLTGIETEGQLQHLPVQGTLRLWENRKFLLQEGIHYTLDYATGSIEFLERASPGSTVTADYRYAVQSVGPIDYQWNRADFETLPGVVMAFGKRGKVGDKVAVVVYGDRVETAKAYGGRFDISFELDILTRDTIQTEEIADLVYMYLWVQKRDLLSFEGIEITDVTIGGEAEEVADETGDEYTYSASMSIQIQSDWESHVPLPLTITRATATTAAADARAKVSDRIQDSTIIGDVQNSLVFSTMTVIAGRNNNFERIL
jgi:hypothetical protein